MSPYLVDFARTRLTVLGRATMHNVGKEHVALVDSGSVWTVIDRTPAAFGEGIPVDMQVRHGLCSMITTRQNRSVQPLGVLSGSFIPGTCGNAQFCLRVFSCAAVYSSL